MARFRPAERLRAHLQRLGAVRASVPVQAIQPMLAETAPEPFSAPGWIFELKHDGFRLLAAREEEGARLVYRRGGEATAVFPEVARAVAALPFERLVLDGEVVVLDPDGRPAFQGLQKRVQLRRRADIERAAALRPATLFAFDLLAAEGFDLRTLPLLERKRLLRSVLPPDGPLRYADHVDQHGAAFYAEVRKLGLEGIMAKRADSAYVGGRSPHWLKLRVDRTGDFVVVGFTQPRDARMGFGALHLALAQGSQLVYAGRVGSGFDEAELQQVRRQLERTRRRQPPCAGPLPSGRGHAWVDPTLVCEVRYKERTEEGLLRQPVFLRFRDDKAAQDCMPEEPTAPAIAGELWCVGGAFLQPPAPDYSGASDSGKQTRSRSTRSRSIAFTNLDKVFWPAECYTKGDLVAFYRAVSAWLLPYLQQRPLVLTRYPDGIGGKSFYQKDAPDFAPGWMRTVALWSDHSQRAIDYFVCEHADALAYLANLGAILLHVWPSRTVALERPDWCILDLDPKGAPFDHVITLARALKRLCDELGLPCFVKTSGASGLHVLVPLGAQCSFEQSRALAHLIAWSIVREHAAIATIERSLRDRQGKVYVDYLQNAHGQLLVAPFSVRPLPGAPVSTPLRWAEVRRGLDPRRFTIRTVLDRLRRMAEDPLRPVLSAKPDLVGALATLQQRLARSEAPPPRRRG